MNSDPDQINAHLENVRREIPLRRDLWPQIMAELPSPAAGQDAQLSATGITSVRRWFAPAALAAGVALVSAILWFQQIRQQTTPPAATLHPTSQLIDPAAFSRVRAALQPDFAAAVDRLAPDTRERVLRNLEIIRKAEADIAAALAEDPSNPLLLELRQQTHEHEVDLMTSLPPANPLPTLRSKT